MMNKKIWIGVAVVVVAVAAVGLYMNQKKNASSVQPEATPQAENPDQNQETVIPEEGMLIRVQGTILEKEEDVLFIESSEENSAYRSVYLMFNEETVIASALDGHAMSPEELEIGDTVTAYISAKMTRSMTPQSQAFCILAEMAENETVPVFSTITEIDKTDGETSILAWTNQDINYHIHEQTVVTDQDGQSVAIEDLTAGMTILAWYDQVAMSLPAQATPSKIVVIKTA